MIGNRSVITWGWERGRGLTGKGNKEIVGSDGNVLYLGYFGGYMGI